MKALAIIVLLTIVAVFALSLVVAAYAQGIALPQYNSSEMNERYMEMLTESMQEPSETPVEYQNLNCNDIRFFVANNVEITEPQERRLAWCNEDPLQRDHFELKITDPYPGIAELERD